MVVDWSASKTLEQIADLELYKVWVVFNENLCMFERPQYKQQN